MDKVLKQRLIGASILIALAVIFVPMLFDGPEGDPVSRELNIELPSAPGDRAPIRRLPLDPEQTRSTPQPDRGSAPGEIDAPIAPPRIRPDVERNAADPQVTEATPRGREASDDEAAGDSTVSLPAAENPPIAPPVPDSEATERQGTDEATARPDPQETVEETDPMPSETAETTGFEVQVASFGSRENAEALVDQLTRLGHVASIDIVVRGPSELHRVRTGPYGLRDDAERALNQISRTVSGVNPVIVGSSAVAAPSTVTESGFAVQVGSFASRDNALRLLEQLGNRGHEAFIHQDRAGSRTIWRVRVGPLGTRDEAAARLERLTEDDGIDGLVVSHP
jgi:cell division septation protein DedD